MAVKETNGIRKFNKWMGFAIAVISLLSLFIGVVAGMTLKSAKIDEAFTFAKNNEKSIYALREIVIRVDTNLAYIRTEVAKLSANR